MCILPNFTERDLETKRDRKEKMKKEKAETVEIVIPKRPLLENSS
jgi:hypothetical protein